MESRELEGLWKRALAELELQLTRAAFDTWLRDTRLLAAGEREWTVGVRNGYAVEWLQGRLHPVIERVAAHVAGAEVAVTYDVLPTGEAASPAALEEQGTLSVEIVEFDPARRGFVQPSNYAIRFWQPYLGCEAFGLWLTLLSYAYSVDRGGDWPSIQLLADICGREQRRRITGRDVQRDGKLVHYEGSLEVLEQERIVWTRYYQAEQRYAFRVLGSLPLLTPVQVKTLSRRLQAKHEAWLRRCELDVREWQQMTLPTLAEGVAQ